MKVKEESEKAGLKLNSQKTKVTASGPITSWQIVRETMEQWETFFGGLQNHCRWWLQPWNEKMLAPWKKSYDKPRQHIKSQWHYFVNKVLSSQSYVFPVVMLWLWNLDHKKSWVPKNWCFWTVVLKKTLENPLDCKKIQPVHPKENQSWIFIGRTDVEAETPILWLPDTKSWLIWKDLDSGKDWRREEKGRKRMSWLDGITDSMDMSFKMSGNCWWTGKPGVLWSLGSQRARHDWANELNWNTRKWQGNLEVFTVGFRE